MNHIIISSFFRPLTRKLGPKRAKHKGKFRSGLPSTLGEDLQTNILG
jgi:hypothetical protein